MKSKDKKFQRLLELLQKQEEQKRKKWILEQQRYARNSASNFSTFSNQRSFFGGGAFYGGYGCQYNVLSNYNKPQRAMIDKSSLNSIVKTNYVFTGSTKNKLGKRMSKKQVVHNAKKNLAYITRDNANQDLDLENYSALYNNKGELLDKDEYDLFKSSLQEIEGFRRTVISPKEELSRDELKNIVVDSIRDFEKESGRNAEFVFAMHSDTQHLHAHVLHISDDKNTLRWPNAVLEHYKEIVYEKTQNVLQERELMVDKTIEQEFEKARIIELEIKEEKEQKNEFSRAI